MEGEVNVNWNEFEVSAANSFKNLWSNKNFTDVTLASEDDHQIRAHKVILSSCSLFFSKILLRNPHANPLIYLKGIRYKELELVMKFIYFGQCQVNEKNLEIFLATGKALEIQGLVTMERDIHVDEDDFNEEVVSSNYETVAHPPIISEKHDVPNTNYKSSEPNISVDDKLIDMETLQAPTEQTYDGSNKCVSKQSITYQNGNAAKEKGSVFKCKLCLKSYTTKHYLTDHMETIHEGIRFDCKKCEYKAKTKNSLKCHIKFIHEGIGYDCDKCDRQFSQKHGLLRHKETSHNQKNDGGENEGVIYGCNQCNYQSIILRELISHKKKIHE